MWRSEEMSYMRLFVPGEAAHAFVDEISRRGIMQFVDVIVLFLTIYCSEAFNINVAVE